MSRSRLMRRSIGLAASVVFLLLAVVLLHPIEQSRTDARAAQCRNNFKQLAIALFQYEEKYGSFPPVFVPDADGQPMHSWRVLLLPFLQDSRADELYKRYRFDEPWDGPNNSLLHRDQVSVFTCPSDNGPYQSRWTSYLAVSGLGTIWRHDEPIRFRDIRDSVAQTLAFVEVADSGIHWMEPRDIPLDSLGEDGATWPPVGTRAAHRVQQFWGFSELHEYAITIDGSVLRIERSTSAKDLWPLCTINGHENCSPIFRQHVRFWKK